MMPPSYGQVVVGPPGSGKTTYCHGMKQFCDATGRKTVVINLDPANDELPYECGVSIFELINLTEVMDCLKLGPNGGLLYCMEYLEKNIDWLKVKLKPLQDQNCYFLFDCPGQVELYTHHNAVKRIFCLLQKLEFRLVAVHLVDSHYCSDPAKFISVLLTSLCTMLHVELPHVNVLSKVDLVEKYGKLPFNLDFFTEVLDLRFLLEHFSTDAFLKKYAKLNKVLTDVIQDYSLVSFSTLYIEDKESVSNLLKVIDKGNGYIFQGESEASISSMLSCAVGADFEYFRSAAVQEKYMHQEDTDFQFDI